MKKIIQKYKAYQKDKKLRLRMGDMYLKTYGATWEQIYFVVNKGVDEMVGSYEKEILKRYR